jgi:hypothetical protein
MLSDTHLGYLILGLGILFVLGLVFAISSRVPAGARRPTPPQGVHLPRPSALPVILSVGAALLGAGLAFKPDDQLFNWFLAVPGLAVLVYGIVSWVRAAGREWREVDDGPARDDAGGH